MNQYSDSIYFSDRTVKIRKGKLQFFPIYYTLSERLHLPSIIFKCPTSQRVPRN
jgi:hypothetical protein